MDPRRERAGLLFAAACALLGGFGPSVAKLTTAQAGALFVAAVTAAFGACASLAVLAARGELAQLGRARLVLLGSLGTGLAFFLFFEGAQRATAIETALCLQVEPAYSLLLSWIALGHRPTRGRVVATLVLLLGIALVVEARSLEASAGVALLLATPLAWQLSHVLVLRGLRGVSAPVLTGARYCFGALFLAALLALRGGAAALPPAADLPRMLPVLALQGVVLSYGGTFLWYQAIARLDLARSTAIVVPSIPVLSLGVGFVLLGEVPTPVQWAGLLLTLAGILGFVTAPAALVRPEAPRGPEAEPANSVRP